MNYSVLFRVGSLRNEFEKFSTYSKVHQNDYRHNSTPVNIRPFILSVQSTRLNLLESIRNRIPIGKLFDWKSNFEINQNFEKISLSSIIEIQSLNRITRITRITRIQRFSLITLFAQIEVRKEGPSQVRVVYEDFPKENLNKISLQRDALSNEISPNVYIQCIQCSTLRSFL